MQDYLQFFMRHNPLYKGVMDANGQQVMPPVEEVEGNWKNVPEDGPLEGVTVEKDSVKPDDKMGDAGDAACVEDLDTQEGGEKPKTTDDEGAADDPEMPANKWGKDLGGHALFALL